MKKPLGEALEQFVPWNEQEERDRALMLRIWNSGRDCLTRESEAAHFSASSWIVNRERNRVLMAYHNIYQAWAWTGGHADGEEDLLQVALREALEETGIHARPISEDIFSLEILTVDGHEKRGRYVPSHLHLNVTYLLEADEQELIRPKTDENTAVRWFGLEEAVRDCGEIWMGKRVYRKLNEKLLRLQG